MDHGDACDLADKALAGGALRVELLLTDTVGEADAAGVLRSGGYLLKRALAGAPAQSERCGNLGLAVIGEEILVRLALGVGQPAAEAVGRCGLKRVVLGEGQTGVGEQTVDRDIFGRGKNGLFAVLPILIADGAGGLERGQLGGPIGLDGLGLAALGLLIDGQNDRLGGLALGRSGEGGQDKLCHHRQTQQQNQQPTKGCFRVHGFVSFPPLFCFQNNGN